MPKTAKALELVVKTCCLVLAIAMLAACGGEPGDVPETAAGKGD
jgi:hypothetical protein